MQDLQRFDKIKSNIKKLNKKNKEGKEKDPEKKDFLVYEDASDDDD